MKFSPDLPPAFILRSVILSHGWTDLPPFSFDHHTETLSRPLLSGGRKIVRAVKDSGIEKHYARFGEWKGLFLWMDLTKGWYEKSYPEIFGS